MKRLICSLTVLVLVAMPLSGCGKKGSPHPPGPSQDVTYPRSYPPDD